ncbi:senecionine N-oxygenase-like isoform X2 [Adelges cooleyi]|uniref:senecionine N-oxygenase-like isoform X2 n=1 Tax=Adelges cooleyi TaxID=133065 RepID=UPI00218001CC|nr:senecionine N-oxygenase-like isoform X2 [Adelges cooleyi]
MKVAVIGAGVAGVACARRCLENGYHCTVYERTNCVGGTWVYVEKVGTDEFGLPIHTSMTNLPKELMYFPDFPYEDNSDSYSLIKAHEVQNYIERFVDHFKLRKHIRFCNLVISVEKLVDTNSWQVTAEDLITKKSNTENYDAVMVCNGHNAVPSMPKIIGMNEFSGISLHSHDYRVPENFANMNVLIIGSGPSGVDISVDVAKVAKQVFLSHHNEKILSKKFPSNVIHKPDVESISKNTVCFNDNSIAEMDAIIYCTGFKIALPFLKSSCGINVEDKLITPLHKIIININNPTMGFIGFLNMTFIFRVFDLQVRYFLKFFQNHLNRCPQNMDFMVEAKTHFIGDSVFNYCKSIANELQIEPIPDIFFEIYRLRGSICFDGNPSSEKELPIPHTATE